MQRTAQPGVEGEAQFARARPSAAGDDEAVEHGAVGPGGDVGTEHGELLRGQHIGEPGEQPLAVSAGDVDLPLIGFGLRAHGHAHPALRGERFHQHGLAGQFLGRVGEEVGGGCEPQTVDGGLVIAEQMLGGGPAGSREIGGLAAGDLRVFQRGTHQRHSGVECFAVASGQVAQRVRHLRGLPGVLGAGEVGGQLQHAGLVERARIAQAGQ